LFSLETTVSTPVGDRPVRLTSLEMPHRYADAYLRDSEVDGKSLDASEIGKPFRLASLDDATALFEREPYSIIYGAWDSHRKGRQAKFPRVYQSTTIGFDPEVGVRKGGRLDPLNLTGLIDKTTTGGDWTFTPDGEKTKGNRLSEIGHGNALDSGGAHGWVTISGGRRMAEVSFAALERVRFGAADDETSARARAALAALALLGDRLAFAKPSWFFRSGCDLVPVRETLAWERAGGELEEFLLDRRAAIALFQHAVEEAKKAGMEMAADVVTLTPRKGLRDAIEHAYVAAEASE
jgi:CRISPR-associated protein Csb1